MRAIRRAFLEQVAHWDMPTRVALSLAVLILTLMLILSRWGAPSVRTPSMIAAAVVFLMVQGLVLWGNRRMVTPFTQAQRHYIAGEFAQAIDILEGVRAGAKVDVQELTLLGNTYRQVGDLSKSARILYEALDISPQNHFPLYGLGRTLLAQGEYTQAAERIEAALVEGAPTVVRVELAEAYYRAGQPTDALRVLDALTTAPQEPYRILWVAYLRHRLAGGSAPNRATLLAGLPYWRESALRFAHTPYSADLQADLTDLEALLQRG